MNQSDNVNIDVVLRVISEALSQSPYPVILTMPTYKNFLEQECGATKNVREQELNFFQIETQIFNYLKREMQTYTLAVNLMTSKNNHKLLENFGVQPVDDAKRIEQFVYSYTRILIRETMNRSQTMAGCERFYRLFISLTVYFVNKYPPLLNLTAFNSLEDTAKERLKTVGTALNSIIYRFNKDINPDNEPISPTDKYILYGVQKFLVGITLKLPKNDEEEGYDQGTIHHTIRYASQLNHLHLQRSKMINTGSLIYQMEVLKSIECLIDLNKWLWENKKVDEERVIEGLEFCNKKIRSEAGSFK